MMLKHTPDKPLVVFMYLGRRGALGRFTLELAEAATRAAGYDFEFFISSSNEIAGDFDRLGLPVTRIDTFDRATPWSLTSGFFKARRQILELLAQRRPAAVVTLMPHVWSPLLSGAIRRLGIKYLTIVHDAVPHPGDKTAWMTNWMNQDAKNADLVITLSRAVAERVIAKKLAEPDRVLPLFHPDLRFGSPLESRDLPAGRALRILFFGRVMKYKGLPLLIDAVELLHQNGIPVHLGLAGSGQLGAERERMEKLGAEIINRWIADSEIGSILAGYDAIACSHVEASQSGVASTAFGNAMPVIAMPVGGIAEQVIDSETGVLARRSTALAFADATHRLASVPGLYSKISRNLVDTAAERSMGRFLNEIVDEIEVLNAGAPRLAPLPALHSDTPSD